MFVMLPTGPVWPALMCATSLWVEVARETGGGVGWVALVWRKGSEMAWYWNDPIDERFISFHLT